MFRDTSLNILFWCKLLTKLTVGHPSNMFNVIRRCKYILNDIHDEVLYRFYRFWDMGGWISGRWWTLELDVNWMIILGSKTIITNFTSVRFLSLMHSLNMEFNIILPRECFITNWTLVPSLSLISFYVNPFIIYQWALVTLPKNDKTKTHLPNIVSLALAWEVFTSLLNYLI